MKANFPIIVVGALTATMMALMALDYFYFRHQGARFTAADGQALCLRVQALDGLPCQYAP